jgi:N-acetylneuraminic acid mutarotase
MNDMNIIRLFCFLLLVELLLLSCKKEAVPVAKEYPYVITSDVENNDNTGVTLVANISSLGNNKIEEYGFVFSKGEGPTIKDFRVTLKTNAKVGEYTYRISNGLERGTRYFVSSYVKTVNYLVYGNIISFYSNGSLPPEIIGFSPAKGHAGTIVEIEGKNFSTFPGLNIVKFGNVVAKIDSVSENKLFVEAPVITETKDVQISVTTANMEELADDSFKFYFSWYKRTNFVAGDTYFGSGFTVSEKGFLYGGYIYDNIINSYLPTKRMWEYDINSNIWTERRECPYQIYSGTSFSHNGKGYIKSSSDDKKIFSYDPKTDSWDIETIYPGNSKVLISVILGDELYTGIGTDFNKIYNEFYKYNFVTKKWTKLNDFPGSPRIFPVAFAINGKAYMGTGFNYFENLYYNDFWEYNPTTDNWVRKADFPGAGRYRACAFSLNNKGYIGLGTREEYYPGYPDFWRYSPELNTWGKIDNYIGKGKWDNIVFSNDNRVFIGPGTKAPSNGSSWSIEVGTNDLWEFIENEY